MSTRDLSLMPLHSGQQEVCAGLSNRTVLRIGRRWGKSSLMQTIAETAALYGQKKVGFFFPDGAIALDTYDTVISTLKPAIKSSNRTEMLIRTVTGGVIEMWGLQGENRKYMGRSRGYDLVLIDEASLIPDLEEIYQKSIEPTLSLSKGPTIMAGTPLGMDDTGFYFKACTIKEATDDWPTVWNEFHRPTSSSPLFTPQMIEDIKRSRPPLVYQQEYEARFVNWSGESLFKEPDLLVDGHGVDYPQHCEYVFATIDTAVKDGAANDGTGVIFWAYNKYGSGSPLTVLDWDLQQIKADMQINWMPSVFNQLDDLARQCKARYGSAGVYIEDKQSGQWLLQHGESVGWPTCAIDARLTQMGKAGRATMASGPVFQGRVKLSQYAYDKTTDYKGVPRNHLLWQVTKFSLNDKQAYKRADDLSDCFTYGVLIVFGGADPLLI